MLFSISSASADEVKLSNSNICHDKSSPSYTRTKIYVSFESIQSCLESGGRLPRTSLSKATNHYSISKYNRKLFPHWSDEDGDCINTRHEVLMELSTSTVSFNNNCNIETGRWHDPYTDKIFFNARDLDVDHLVPLKWAWQHGAHEWSYSKRKLFANDKRNLFAVMASVNRNKGAKGPLKWLPPNNKFHCQYISRFIRITKLYELNLTKLEHTKINDLKVKKCSQSG